MITWLFRQKNNKKAVQNEPPLFGVYTSEGALVLHDNCLYHTYERQFVCYKQDTAPVEANHAVGVLERGQGVGALRATHAKTVQQAH